MASKCIDDCVNIENDALCIRPGTTYTKLYKWPVAEAEFVRSISNGGSQRCTTVVDSISCRQMYLRSYTFSRKEESEEDGNRISEWTCFGGGRRKTTAKEDMKTSKTASYKAFVVRLVWKYLSCVSSNDH